MGTFHFPFFYLTNAWKWASTPCPLPGKGRRKRNLYGRIPCFFLRPAWLLPCLLGLITCLKEVQRTKRHPHRVLKQFKCVHYNHVATTKLRAEIIPSEENARVNPSPRPLFAPNLPFSTSFPSDVFLLFSCNPLLKTDGIIQGVHPCTHMHQPLRELWSSRVTVIREGSTRIWWHATCS